MDNLGWPAGAICMFLDCGWNWRTQRKPTLPLEKHARCIWNIEHLPSSFLKKKVKDFFLSEPDQLTEVIIYSANVLPKNIKCQLISISVHDDRCYMIMILTCSSLCFSVSISCFKMTCASLFLCSLKGFTINSDICCLLPLEDVIALEMTSYILVPWCTL